MRVPSFSFSFCRFSPAVHVFLYPRSTQLPSNPTCKFKAQVFCHLWSLIPEAHPWRSGPAPQSAVLSSDGGEMDDGKRLILMAQTSVRLTNGSPKLGKPLADRGRSEAGPSPADFHESPFQSAGPCQATTRRRVLAPPHVRASLRRHQPACWHRAGPQSLMNKPSKETWRVGPSFHFTRMTHAAGGGLWELKMRALIGIMNLPPSVYSLSTLMSWFRLEFGQSEAEVLE